MLVAEDLGNFYRIPADNRDLNYDKYFDLGIRKLSKIEDYNSHNTHRLTISEMQTLLEKLELNSSNSRLFG